MKYYTWKLKWVLNPETGNLEGRDPNYLFDSDLVVLDPRFSTGDPQDPNTLTYVYLLKGEINPAELTDWSVTETTAEAMLDAAKLLEPNAVLEDGLIKFPPIESNIF